MCIFILSSTGAVVSISLTQGVGDMDGQVKGPQSSYISLFMVIFLAICGHFVFVLDQFVPLCGHFTSLRGYFVLFCFFFWLFPPLYYQFASLCGCLVASVVILCLFKNILHVSLVILGSFNSQETIHIQCLVI